MAKSSAKGERQRIRTGITRGRRIEEPILRTLIALFAQVHVEGMNHMPKSGPLIIILNHVHWLDPPIMVAKCPRYTVPIAKVETMDYPVLGKLMRWYPVIPIRRGEADLAAVRWSRAELAAGNALLIEPEGTRSKSGALQRGQPGTIFLARQTDAVILPAAITGTVGLGTNLRRLRRGQVQIRLGQPFRFRWPEAGRVPREVMQAMTDEAMYRIAGLLPEDMRGAYGDLGQATTNHLDFDLTPTP